MKVYLSGPISIYNDEMLAFQKLKTAELKIKSILVSAEVTNPMEIEEHKKNITKDYNKFMRVDIKYLLQCETAIFTENWTKSKGCLWEFVIAKEFGLSCIHLKDNGLIGIKQTPSSIIAKYKDLMFKEKHSYLESFKK